VIFLGPWILWMLGLSAGAPNPAATAEPPAVHEEMVVTAERGPESRDEIPASVSVLNRTQIESLPANDLGELVGFLPGFHALFRGDFGGPAPIVMSRGFFGGGEAEYVQLRIDGVPVADVESGLVDWRGIRTSDIERVEALRGPGASLYGDAAMGGVIQVFTRPSSAGESRWSASAAAGSFGTVSAGAAYQFGTGLFDGRGGGTYARTDGDRDHNAEEIGILGLSTSGVLGTGRWSLEGEGNWTRREEPGALPKAQYESDDRFSDPLYRFDETTGDRGRLALGFRQDSAPVPYGVTVFGSLRDSDILRTLPVAPGLGNRTLRELHTGAVGAILQGQRSYSLFGQPASVLLGAELGHETLDTKYRFVDDDGRAGPVAATENGFRNRSAFFLTTDANPTPRLRISAGVRWDWIADDFHVADVKTRNQAWSPRAGLNYRLGDLGAPVAVYFQYSRSFKAPTVDQLFDPHPFDFGGNTFTISNPHLVPQRAENLEIGASQNRTGWRWEALAYRMTVEDEIDFDPATFSYANIGQSLHRGVEASVRVTDALPVAPFVSYVWTRVSEREGENAGKQLKNIPEHLVTAGLSAPLPAGIRVEAGWTWMGGRYLDDADLFPLGDASVFDLRAMRDFGPLQVRADVLNLTNARYAQYGYTLTGFDGGTVPYYYPGSRLGARIGVEWRN
jgi:outer membrane receptor protein involved in Fe transport